MGQYFEAGVPNKNVMKGGDDMDTLWRTTGSSMCVFYSLPPY
jgi:hypothetical protein